MVISETVFSAGADDRAKVSIEPRRARSEASSSARLADLSAKESVVPGRANVMAGVVVAGRVIR